MVAAALLAAGPARGAGSAVLSPASPGAARACRVALGAERRFGRAHPGYPRTQTRSRPNVRSAADEGAVGRVEQPVEALPVVERSGSGQVRGALFVNPGSGKGSPGPEELAEEARRRGLTVHVLDQGDDLAALAREVDADVLGMAGGDGSLAPVAQVAIERDLPFVCVPFGTRNHFARDAGIGTDPIAALAAFERGTERRVDVGRVADRIFLNNLSLGIYARLVRRRERERRRGQALARLRALVRSLGEHRRSERFLVDGVPVEAGILLVSNNAYSTDIATLGERARLDEGRLFLYAARGVRRLTWTERDATELEIVPAAPRPHAALDGEPTVLESPLRVVVAPGALRLLVPPPADDAG